MLLGTDPSPWNNAEITDGRRAQEALDLATKVASEFWPEFEQLLGQVVHRLGVWPPGTFNEVAVFLAVLRDVRRARDQYSAEIWWHSLAKSRGRSSPPRAVRSAAPGRS